MELKLIYECVHKKTGDRQSRSVTRTICNLETTLKEAYNVYHEDKRTLEKQGYKVDFVMEVVE